MNSGKIVAGGRTDGWTGIEGSIRGPRGPKKLFFFRNISSIRGEWFGIPKLYMEFWWPLLVGQLECAPIIFVEGAPEQEV